MIEIRINRDIGSYDARLFGRFTLRQTICILVAAPICWAIYKYLSPILSEDITGFLIAVPAAAAVAIGWLKPYGMRTEKFIGSVFINTVLAPKHRKYKTENVHEKSIALLEKHIKEQEALESHKKSLNMKNRSPKKPKYKVSANAVR